MTQAKEPYKIRKESENGEILCLKPSKDYEVGFVCFSIILSPIKRGKNCHIESGELINLIRQGNKEHTHRLRIGNRRQGTDTRL